MTKPGAVSRSRQTTALPPTPDVFTKPKRSEVVSRIRPEGKPGEGLEILNSGC